MAAVNDAAKMYRGTGFNMNAPRADETALSRKVVETTRAKWLEWTSLWKSVETGPANQPIAGR